MKTLVTGEIDFKILSELNELCSMEIAGWAKETRKLDEYELIKLLKDKDILITSYDDVTKEVIKKSNRLKLIACTRSNPVNIDIYAAKEKNISVIYTPGRNSDSAAEFTIALMLNIARKIPMAYKALKDGEFLADNNINAKTKEGLKEDITWALGENSPYVIFKGFQLKDKKLGIIGYGDIGKKVANLAKCFGMFILVYDPFIPKEQINIEKQKKVDFDKLLSESDFISCHSKVTKETRGMIGEKEISKMKETAYLINTSRGALIDENALIESLKEKKIAGAALDVFQSEPLNKTHPFIKDLENVIITPHLGGAAFDVISNHTRMIVNDIKRFINEEKMINIY